MILLCCSELGETQDSDDLQEENMEQDAAEGAAAMKEEAQKQKGKSGKRRNKQEDDDDDIISKYGLDDYDGDEEDNGMQCTSKYVTFFNIGR